MRPKTAFFFLILFLATPPFLFAQERSFYPGVIHIHSNISTGVNSPEEIVNLSRENGIKVLVFSDSFLRHWEYGIPALLPKLFKVSKDEPSVSTYGTRKYKEGLERIKNRSSVPVILEGVEITPFYWWSGSFFKRNLCLNGANKHLLVIGLNKTGDYAHLPVIGNRYFFPRLKDLPALLIALVLAIPGAFLFRRNKRVLGLILVAGGALFLLQDFPFRASSYGPYQGLKYKSAPYQELINYVNKKGGLVFWAHPEMTETGRAAGRFAGINFYTPAYPRSLLETSGYSGFGVNMLPGTEHGLILAGGVWDKVLASYCENKRSRPAWVIGEADYRGRSKIESVQNLFLLNALDPASAFFALKNGRLYVRYYEEGRVDISLGNFSIADSLGQGVSVSLGEEILVRGKARLRLKGNYRIDLSEGLRLEVIRNGKIIREVEFKEKAGAFDLDFEDEPPGGKSYYRLNFFSANRIILVTNPVFVRV